jgi:hypothetical protein
MGHEPQRKHQKSKQQARVHFQQPSVHQQQPNHRLYSTPSITDYHRNTSLFNSSYSYQHLQQPTITTQPAFNNCNFF